MAIGQSLKLTKGAITQDLTINDSTSERFSLYVPKDFDPQKSYKTLFLFDPQGNGIRATRLLTSSMVTDDYVIASNEWKLSDDLEVNINVAAKMIQRVVANILVDRKHVYAAGLDEGALTASGLTYVLNGIQGLLLVNDVFYKNQNRISQETPITIGLVANSSENYYKVNDIFDSLKGVSKSNDLYIYEGDGGWPESSYFSSLFSTLQFRVSEKMDDPLSDSLVRKSFVQDSTTAEILRRKKEYLIAYDFIDLLKDKYRGKMNLRPLRNQIQELRRDKGYRNARRSFNRNIEEEYFLKEDLSYFLQEDIAMASFDNLGYWDERMRELDTAKNNDKKPYEQLVAKRVTGYVDGMLKAYETAFDSRILSLEQAIFFNVLKSVIHPKDFEAYKNIISLTAKDNDDKTAYFYLDKMLSNGYKDYEAVYDIPDTEVLHISTEFNKIVKKYFGKSKF
ncbi:MAG: hypothetical protein WA951_06415 [Leeuwenhoekiella sp.]